MGRTFPRSMVAPWNPTESVPSSDAVAMLVRAMGTDKQRSRSLGIAWRLTVGPYVFERASFGTPFKAACVNLPANCMFVVIPIEGLHPVSYARGLYIQGK